MMNSGLFTSNTDEWSTPQEFFDQWDSEYHFTLDSCATSENHKCERYFSKEENGLVKNWGGEIVWCNPPYGKQISKWVEKCYSESMKPDTKVIALLPARTDTKWFHDFIYKKARIIFVKGRLKFGGAKNSAPFPSMIVIW